MMALPVAVLVGLLLPVLELARGHEAGWHPVKALCVLVMAAAVLRGSAAEGRALFVSGLVLVAAGILLEDTSFPLAVLCYTFANLLFINFFLSHVRRRRWLLPLGLLALAYTLLALAWLTWVRPAEWVAPAVVYAGFSAAAAIAAAVSRIRWAGLGMLLVVLADAEALLHVEGWPDGSITNHLNWTLSFAGLAVMSAAVMRGPSPTRA